MPLVTPLVHQCACPFAGGGHDTSLYMFALRPRSFGTPAAGVMLLKYSRSKMVILGRSV